MAMLDEKTKKYGIAGAIAGFAIPFVNNFITGFGMIPEMFVGAISGAIILIILAKANVLK